MKIKETIERDCCDQRDMKPYQGDVPPQLHRGKKGVYFCQHCGQLWWETSEMDAAGGRDTKLVKISLSV